jgi:hypothetical protein
MSRGVKVVALIFSHIALFFIGATVFTGYRTQAQFRAAEKDPLFRVGAALTQPGADKAARASLDADLTALSRMLRAPTGDVIRLVALLELDRLDEARVACAALAWPHCDPQSLADMRKAVRP